jgi:hypothetical protein
VKPARPIETRVSGFCFYSNEIIGVFLAKQIGTVAWDFCAGRVWGDPFAPERKVNDNWRRYKSSLRS